MCVHRRLPSGCEDARGGLDTNRYAHGRDHAGVDERQLRSRVSSTAKSLRVLEIAMILRRFVPGCNDKCAGGHWCAESDYFFAAFTATPAAASIPFASVEYGPEGSRSR